MYDELIKRLRTECTLPFTTLQLMREAADAIEKLSADVRPVVTCADCEYNNSCLTQVFVEEESRVPFDRNTFFCSDGKRADDA